MSDCPFTPEILYYHVGSVSDGRRIYPLVSTWRFDGVRRKVAARRLAQPRLYEFSQFLNPWIRELQGVRYRRSFASIEEASEFLCPWDDLPDWLSRLPHVLGDDVSRPAGAMRLDVGEPPLSGWAAAEGQALEHFANDVIRKFWVNDVSYASAIVRHEGTLAPRLSSYAFDGIQEAGCCGSRTSIEKVAYQFSELVLDRQMWRRAHAPCSYVGTEWAYRENQTWDELCESIPTITSRLESEVRWAKEEPADRERRMDLERKMLRVLAGHVRIEREDGNDAFLEAIEQPGIRHMKICADVISSVALHQLSRCTELKSLHMNGQIPIDAFSQCGSWPRLSDLAIQFSSIEDVALGCLSELDSLTRLCLNRCRAITDVGIGHLRTLSQLQNLSIYRTSITDESMVHIATLRRLKTLRLHITAVTTGSVRYLQDLPDLRVLDFEGNRMSEERLTPFSKLTELEQLDLPWLGVTDEDVGHLLPLQNLKRLVLTGGRITDEGFLALRELPSLRQVGVQQTQVTDEAIRAFRKALPDCTLARRLEDQIHAAYVDDSPFE